MDFDDELFDSDGGADDRPDRPDFRMTMQRSGAVRLVSWRPWLPSSGPACTLMAARDRAGITIADLRVIRDDEGTAQEVIVEFHSGGHDTHRAGLCDWAQAVGYRRVWFDDEVVDLEPIADGPVTTCCTGCGQQFVDGHSGQFWHHIRRSGAFPTVCCLCGSDLPQWTRGPRATGAAEQQPVTQRPPHTGDRPRRR